MKRSIITLAAIVMVGCQPGVNPEQQLASNTAEVVKPAYDRLQDSLTRFSQKAEAFCLAPTAVNRTAVEQQWKASMLRWQQANVVNFGPITLDSMAWKFQFWPDRKNLTRKKVETALAADKQWTRASISKASVVARGFGAAEYLLFDPEVSKQISEPRRCQYLKVVAEVMQRNAGKLSRNWQSGEQRYPEEMLSMVSDDPDNNFLVSGMLVGSINNALELTKRKLRAPFGKNVSNVGNPYQAESWRSRTSLDNIRVTLAASAELFRGGKGYGLDDRLTGKGESGRLIAEEVTTAFTQALASANSPTLTDVSLFDAVADPGRREAVNDLLVSVSRLNHLFAGKVPDKLDIPPGFNANDGD